MTQLWKADDDGHIFKVMLWNGDICFLTGILCPVPLYAYDVYVVMHLYLEPLHWWLRLTVEVANIDEIGTDTSI